MSAELVVFNLNNREYALPVKTVREITKLSDVTPVPDSLPYIKGIINLRGKAIPVIDIHRRLGLRRSHCELALIAEVEGTTFGLAVNGVREVSILGETQPAPPIVASPFVTGIINLPERMVMILKLDHIIGDQEQAALEDLVG